jgi:hypothetical protein
MAYDKIISNLEKKIQTHKEKQKKTKKLTPVQQIKHNIRKLRKTVLQRKYEQKGKKLNAFLGNPKHDEKIKQLTEKYVGRSKGYRLSPTRGLIKGDVVYSENVNNSLRKIERKSYKRRPANEEDSQKMYNSYNVYLPKLLLKKKSTKEEYGNYLEYMKHRNLYRPGISRSRKIVYEHGLNDNPYVTPNALSKLGDKPYPYLKTK